MKRLNTALNISTAILIFVSLTLCIGCLSKTEKKKFESMYHAAKAIDNFISDSTGYAKYKELFEKYSAEILSAKETVKSEDARELLKAYSDLLTIYQDGYSLWEYKIESSIYGWIPNGRIYLEPSIQYIAEKYKLPKESHVIELTNHHFETVSADSIQAIWNKAHKEFKRIKRLNLYHFIYPWR